MQQLIINTNIVTIIIIIYSSIKFILQHKHTHIHIYISIYIYYICVYILLPYIPFEPCSGWRALSSVHIYPRFKTPQKNNVVCTAIYIKSNIELYISSLFLCTLSVVGFDEGETRVVDDVRAIFFLFFLFIYFFLSSRDIFARSCTFSLMVGLRSTYTQ